MKFRVFLISMFMALNGFASDEPKSLKTIFTDTTVDPFSFTEKELLQFGKHFYDPTVPKNHQIVHFGESFSFAIQKYDQCKSFEIQGEDQNYKTCFVHAYAQGKFFDTNELSQEDCRSFCDDLKDGKR